MISNIKVVSITDAQFDQVLQAEPQHFAGNEIDIGSESLDAHIAKMSIANSSGALKRQFDEIVTEKSFANTGKTVLGIR